MAWVCPLCSAEVDPRSQYRTTPILAHLNAKHMDMTVGEEKKIAAEGTIRDLVRCVQCANKQPFHFQTAQGLKNTYACESKGLSQDEAGSGSGSFSRSSSCSDSQGPQDLPAAATAVDESNLTPQMLLQEGCLAATVPPYAKPLFLGLSNKLLTHALDAKIKGDQSAWERRLIRWFAALSSLLKRTGGGTRGRGKRRLIKRLNRLAESLSNAVDTDLEPAEDKEEQEEEVREEREEKEMREEREEEHIQGSTSESDRAVQKAVYLFVKALLVVRPKL